MAMMIMMNGCQLDEPGAPVKGTNTATAPVRHSTRARKAPAWHSYYFIGNVMKSNQANVIHSHVGTEVNPTFACFVSHAMNVTEPKHFKDAIYQDMWVDAMNEELNALEINNALHITTL